MVDANILITPTDIHESLNTTVDIPDIIVPRSNLRGFSILPVRDGIVDLNNPPSIIKTNRVYDRIIQSDGSVAAGTLEGYYRSVSVPFNPNAVPSDPVTIQIADFFENKTIPAFINVIARSNKNGNLIYDVIIHSISGGSVTSDLTVVTTPSPPNSYDFFDAVITSQGLATTLSAQVNDKVVYHTFLLTR